VEVRINIKHFTDFMSSGDEIIYKTGLLEGGRGGGERDRERERERERAFQGDLLLPSSHLFAKQLESVNVCSIYFHIK
jgi:hypothetical protein